MIAQLAKVFFSLRVFSGQNSMPSGMLPITDTGGNLGRKRIRLSEREGGQEPVAASSWLDSVA